MGLGSPMCGLPGLGSGRARDAVWYGSAWLVWKVVKTIKRKLSNLVAHIRVWLSRTAADDIAARAEEASQLEHRSARDDLFRLFRLGS